MATVTYEHVTKRFGKVIAVNDMSIHIPDKEFIVLVGPSGCGKTTALRLLAGLEEITKGTIKIDDRVVNNVFSKDRDIAMVFQSYALYPHMSVYENMAFGLYLRKIPKDQIRRKVQQAAEGLGIENLFDRKPRELSGGQRQRVALGRAIVREPRVFLFDEPLSNLDAKLRVQTRGEIIKLHNRLQSTFIYVTHDQVEAMTMASKIAVMKDGFLQQVDTPQNIYDHPGNAFVASFIGSPSMNFFNARLEGADNLSIVTESFQIPVPKTKLPMYEKFIGKNVIFGLRPEDIHDPSFVPPNIQPAKVKADVDIVETMGKEMFVNLVVGKSTFICLVDPRLTKISARDQVEVIFDMGKMHLFEPDGDQKVIQAIRY